MKPLFPVFLTLLVLATSGCAWRVDVEADTTAINRLREEAVAAFNAGDVTGLAAVFTDDAVRMPPNQPSATGKQAIEAQYRAFFDQFTAQLNLVSDEIVVAGDWAFACGTYTLTVSAKASNEATRDRGNYLDILQRQPDSSWKYARHIWNSVLPAPRATAVQPKADKALPRLLFAVQLGAYEKRGVAEALGRELSSRYQYTTLVAPVKVRGKTLYRVRIPVETKAEAEALAARIRREEKIKTWVVSLPKERRDAR